MLTPLEVGMYALLAVFCAAMAVFIASCFVYARRFHHGGGHHGRPNYPMTVAANAGEAMMLSNMKSKSIEDANDWVWLGKGAPGGVGSGTSSASAAATLASRTGTGLSRHSETHRHQRQEMSSQNSSPNLSDAVSFQSSSSNRRSQRLSYVGSEINIIPNPQTEEYEAEVTTPPPASSETAPLAPQLPRRGASAAPFRIPPSAAGFAEPTRCHSFAPRRPQGATRPPPEYRPPKKRMLPPAPPIQVIIRIPLT